MRRGKNVIASFAIPDGAPPAVEAAQARFNEVATRWARLIGEVEDAEYAVEAAKEKDARAIATAFDKGKPPPADPAGNERDALAKLAGLRGLLKAAGDAVDEAGNEMLGPIEEAKSDWIDTLRPAVDGAHERYQAAIAAARGALGELQTAKAAVAWLENFEAGEARVGRATRSFQGRGPRALVEDAMGGQHDVTVLLELAARVGEPSGAERRAARHAKAAA